MSYKFFQNRNCEYFPCHEIDSLNCLFCFCPLYYLDKCGGNYLILKNGVKDCSRCLIPHQNDGYERIMKVIKAQTKK